MFDLYTVLKYLHVLAAIFWVGGGIHAWLTSRTGTANLARLLQASRGADKLYPVAAIVVLVTGLWMTADVWSFGQAWIVIGIVLFVATSVLGGAVVSRQTAAVAEDLRAGVETPESIGPRLAPLTTYFNIDIVIMMLIVVVMVFKPGA